MASFQGWWLHIVIDGMPIARRCRMYPNRIGRLEGFDYTGLFSYFLTLRTFSRRERFREPRVVAQTDRIFREIALQEGFRILAHCYMPDHVHFVVEGLERDSNLVEFIGAARQCSGYWHAQNYQLPLWQVGWFDHIIRGHEEVARYVWRAVANPVRAGYVDRWDDWPFSATELTPAGEDLSRVQAAPVRSDPAPISTSAPRAPRSSRAPQ